MPNYKQHLAAGAVAGGVALLCAHQYPSIDHSPRMQALLFAVTLIASVFPDIDTASKGRTWVYGSLAVIDMYLLYTCQFELAALLGFMALLPCIGTHRGWTHTWWAMFLVPLPLLLSPMHIASWTPEMAAPWYIAGIIGYGSHLLLDRTW